METNKIYNKDCIKGMKELPDNSVDSVVTDPPYGLNFMGKDWDKFKNDENPAGGNTGRDTPYARNRVAPAFYHYGDDEIYNFQKFNTIWAKEALRVLKPGGHLLSFGGTRTYHRMACAIEDAGFEIRDQIMWVYGCLSEDTEILTTNGWKSYNDIETQDIVFSFDLNKHRILKSKINHIFRYNHNGKMVNLKNHNTNQLLTLNHKVINKKGYRKQKYGKRKYYQENDWVYRDAWQIRSDYYNLPLAGVFDGDYSIGKDFAEVIGWVLSDGHFQKDTKNAVNIYQSSVNSEKVSRIRYCLARANIKYNEYEREREYNGKKYIMHQWYISGEDGKKIKKIIPNKKPTKKLWDLKFGEKLRLIKGLCGGDGSKDKKGKYTCFYQNDMSILIWFQTLLHLSGLQGVINKNKMCCSIHYNDSTQIQRKHKNRIVDYNGIVWCIESEFGNFIAKRKNKIFITGNSGFPKSHNIGKAIDSQDTEEFRQMVGNTIRESRIKKGWSMDKLCRELNLNDEGHGGMVNHYENGRATPTLELWEKICELLSINEISEYKKLKDDRLEVVGVTENPISWFGKGLKKVAKSKKAKKWSGWGTALKPAHEPIVLARKPIEKDTIAKNVLEWDTGGINIDDCRIPLKGEDNPTGSAKRVFRKNQYSDVNVYGNNKVTPNEGRFPANFIHDGSNEVVSLFPETGVSSGGRIGNAGSELCMTGTEYQKGDPGFGDSGSAARFFYCAKASSEERNLGCGKLNTKRDGMNFGGELDGRGKKINIGEHKNSHPTVKPVDLMRYLCRLITPPKGIVLDPFMGSGTTAIATQLEGFKYIGFEKNADYCKIARARAEKYYLHDEVAEAEAKNNNLTKWLEE